MTPQTALLPRAFNKASRTAWVWERALRRTVLRAPARVECPVCAWTGPSLAPSRKPRRANRICPRCGSSERYRALELSLRARGTAPQGARLLEVAPIHTVQHTAERLGYHYTSVDLQSQHARVLGDLCTLPFADGAFDLVVCFHVLEHIPRDVSAVRELARVVGPNGAAIVVVPRDIDRAVTFEDPDADPADYERLYGQSDHVRIYGADIMTRWADAQVHIEEQPWDEQFTPDEHRRAALSGDDDQWWIIRSTD